MLKIGICDDDVSQIEQIHSWIDETLWNRMELKITHFSSGEEVVAAIRAGTFDCHLLFVDIHMEKLNGIDTVAYIRKRHIDVDVIFLTVSTEYVYEGYIHKAYAYLLKPIEESVLKEVLERYVDEWEKVGGYIEVRTAGGIRKIWLDKVLYFTSDVRVVDAHLSDGVIRFYGKLGEIEKKLQGKDFLRCHQSFLVNRKQIERMTRGYFVVQGTGERIPVSRTRYEKLRQSGLFETEGSGGIMASGNRSLSENVEENGAVVGIAGKFTGSIIRIRSNQKIVFGRNHEMADFVMDEQSISRKHCWIQYNGQSGEYLVCDCSANGVFVNESYYLEKEKIVILKKGDELRFADTDNVFKLG